MFKSKIRSIIIPQYEHGRLAGTVASLWGNDDFARPVIDFASFVQGVALHDWHYGPIDNLPIGEAAVVFYRNDLALPIIRSNLAAIAKTLLIGVKIVPPIHSQTLSPTLTKPSL